MDKTNVIWNKKQAKHIFSEQLSVTLTLVEPSDGTKICSAQAQIVFNIFTESMQDDKQECLSNLQMIPA